ncbi:spore protease YyaC [Thermoflavimicrobium dichotomicum]|uniref:Putative sporulation protein YyaC n=1 Tax=Thermoflavimicrobium dichotomicum TaxID=46223 RepID=A0A1I3KCS1_9BACL|nr:spore protease YyaC [Thermoflavimicrobium dichotomicum]SFI70140.1 putative sporulation protein YyaC [Thermoflavimicrobium dichotomicum]
MREFHFISKTHSFTFPYRMEYTHPLARQHFSDHLAYALKDIQSNIPIICVCIGTDRSTGDSLGPLVGTFLSKQAPANIKVFGTLDEPVHALNLQETIHHIQNKYPESPVIAVDACLGHFKNVGWIQLGLGPIKPGAGVKKELPEVGQIHIKGIVNVSGFMEYMILQNTRLSVVMKMAEVIASSILTATSSEPISSSL